MKRYHSSIRHLKPKLLIVFSLLMPVFSYAQKGKVEKELNDISIKLLTAMGSSIKIEDRPIIKLSDTQLKGASYDNEKQIIYLDLVAYEVCKNFGNYGDAALAFIIGHELGHFYYNSPYSSGMGFVDGSKRMMDYMYTEATEDSSPEVMADYFGIMSAHLAGYPVIFILDSIFDALDKKYPALGIGYPSIEIRQKVDNLFKEKAIQLIRINELALLLQILKDYDAAANCYIRILKDFKNPDTYNNLAITYLEKAVQLYQAYIDSEVAKHEASHIVYGFEIDYNFRLFSPYSLYLDVKLKDITDELKNLIEKADTALKEVIKLDPNNATAHLNRAWAALLLTSIEVHSEQQNKHLLQCKIFAKNASELAKANQDGILQSSAQLCLLLARGKEMGVQNIIEELGIMANNATDPINDMAKMNMALLSGKVDFDNAEILFVQNKGVEKNLAPINYCIPETGNQKVNMISLQDNTKVILEEFSCSNKKLIQYIYNESLVFKKTKELESMNSGAEKISLNSSLKEVKSIFESNDVDRLPVKTGFFVVYELNKVILKFNAQEKLIDWWTYQQIKP